MKIQEKNYYQFWKEVPIDYIDTFGGVPEMELETPGPHTNTEDAADINITPQNDDGWSRKENEKLKKKNASPVQLERKKRGNDFSAENMAIRIKVYLNGTGLQPLDN